MSVPRSPEDVAPIRHGRGTNFRLIAAVCGVLVLCAVIWPQYALVSGSRAGPLKSSTTQSRFPGASETRIFLSEADSRAAASQGLLPPGTRSVIATGGRLGFGQWRWDERAVPAGPIIIRADLSRQLVSVFKGKDEIGTAVIVYGIDGKETPRGRLPILGKTRDYHSITYDAPMPYSLWLRDDGVAIHGSTVRMGKATNGCIGVPIEFAAKLFAVAGKGDIVEVMG